MSKFWGDSGQGDEVYDFLTIMSILCDNAIEAHGSPDQPHVSITFFKNGAQGLVIETPSKEGASIFSEIFSFGPVLKGRERGVGLYTSWRLWKPS